MKKMNETIMLALNDMDNKDINPSGVRISMNCWIPDRL